MNTCAEAGVTDSRNRPVGVAAGGAGAAIAASSTVEYPLTNGP